MEKINDELFKKHELSKNEQFFARGGTSVVMTTNPTQECESTWYFWEDCSYHDDTQRDESVLPAANNIGSR